MEYTVYFLRYTLLYGINGIFLEMYCMGWTAYFLLHTLFYGIHYIFLEIYCIVWYTVYLLIYTVLYEIYCIFLEIDCVVWNILYLYIYIWGLCCQKQVSQAGISNYIPQFTVGCNYLSLPEILASGILAAKSSYVCVCALSYGIYCTTVYFFRYTVLYGIYCACPDSLWSSRGPPGRAVIEMACLAMGPW